MVDARGVGCFASSGAGDCLMDNHATLDTSLTSELRAVVWRIFGSGHSPFTSMSEYALIERIVRSEDVTPNKQKLLIAEVQGWFEGDGNRRTLRSEMDDAVATLILEAVGELLNEGVEAKVLERGAWAVGAIDAERSARVIRSRWCRGQIGVFVDVAVRALKKLGDRDEVLDPMRTARFVGLDADAKISKDDLRRNGTVETFQHLDTHGFGLVHVAMRDVATNLVGVVLRLQPDEFESIVGRLDHPLLLARAADYVIDEATPRYYRKPLQWIRSSACDDLIALAIVHTLNTVNRLDGDLHSATSRGSDHHYWSTELRHPQDDLDSAATDLLTGLVDRLGLLDPKDCVRWVGELLSNACRALHHPGRHDKPIRIEQLERACSALLGRLVTQSWSDDLYDALREGLRMSHRPNWTRHLVEVAWGIRDVAPSQAADLARAVLKENDQQIADTLVHGHLYLNWTNWEDREWMSCLGVTLALSSESLNLPEWVSERCRALPLSVWDAEDDVVAFGGAEEVARHWFLVAFLAIPALQELGRRIDPTAVRAIVRSLWDHCHFAGQYLLGRAEDPVVTEHAARLAIKFGDPSDSWLLDQARHPGVGPCTLWALVDQCSLESTRECGLDVQYQKTVATEFRNIASERFKDGGRFSIDELRFWGELWLLLNATNEAEHTAVAISAVLRRTHHRAYAILVLKLLAFVDSERKLRPELVSHARSLYNEIWPSSYTPDEERDDRRKIDDRFRRDGPSTSQVT